MSNRTRLVALAAGGLALLAHAESASAGQRDGLRVAYAESRHGNGSISGPVRLARYGYEVRLPGGTWMPCGRSCSETLRRETVDFWENHSQGKSEGVGYLRWRW